jgi:hypothetical protein
MQLQPVAALSSNYLVMQDAYSCIAKFEYTEVRTEKPIQLLFWPRSRAELRN